MFKQLICLKQITGPEMSILLECIVTPQNCVGFQRATETPLSARTNLGLFLWKFLKNKSNPMESVCFDENNRVPKYLFPKRDGIPWNWPKRVLF